MYGGYVCRYVGVIISVALPGAFCFVFVHDVSTIFFLFLVFCSDSCFPSVLLTISSSVGENSVSTQSIRSSCLCLCGSRFSRKMSFNRLSGTVTGGFPVSEFSRVSHRPSLLGDPWYPPTCPPNTFCFALQCYCPHGLSLLPQCLVVLVCIVTVMFVPCWRHVYYRFCPLWAAIG